MFIFYCKVTCIVTVFLCSLWKWILTLWWCYFTDYFLATFVFMSCRKFVSSVCILIFFDADCRSSRWTLRTPSWTLTIAASVPWQLISFLTCSHWVQVRMMGKLHRRYLDAMQSRLWGLWKNCGIHSNMTVNIILKRLSSTWSNMVESSVTAHNVNRTVHSELLTCFAFSFD